MSWHFSLALVEEFSRASFSGGEQFAAWKSLPTAADDSCSDKLKDTSHLSQFGTMYAPSTEGPGKDLLMWFLEASPAPTFHEIRSLCKRLYMKQGGVDTQALLGHADEKTAGIYADPRGIEPVFVKVG